VLAESADAGVGAALAMAGRASAPASRPVAATIRTGDLVSLIEDLLDGRGHREE
jgi:hypothetical protein